MASMVGSPPLSTQMPRSRSACTPASGAATQLTTKGFCTFCFSSRKISVSGSTN